MGDEGGKACLELWSCEYLIGDFPQKTNLQKFSLLFGQAVGLFLGFVFLNDALAKNRPLLQVGILRLFLILRFFFMISGLINFFCFLGFNLDLLLKLSFLFFFNGILLFFDLFESLCVDDRLNPLGF